MKTIEAIYRENLARLIAEQGSQAKLSKLTGKSPAQISQWLNASIDSKSGKPRVMSRESARELEQLLGKSEGWMDTDHGTESSNVSEIGLGLAPTRLVPVVGHVKGGDDGYLDEMQFPVGHGEGFVPYWTKDPAAYALRVRGDSMYPRYRAREFIVVTPSIEAVQGNDVVVRLKDGRKLLKQLNWRRDGEVQLMSVNDGYAPITLQMEDVESIHRVAGGVPPDAFQDRPWF